jgi:hypothetical protein
MRASEKRRRVPAQAHPQGDAALSRHLARSGKTLWAAPRLYMIQMHRVRQQPRILRSFLSDCNRFVRCSLSRRAKSCVARRHRRRLLGIPIGRSTIFSIASATPSEA